jgi:hypothetical protein
MHGLSSADVDKSRLYTLVFLYRNLRLIEPQTVASKIQTPYVLTMSLVIQYSTVLQSYFSCRCSQECYVSQEEKKKQFTCQPCC